MGYEDCRSIANIVIDGSPNEATVLTLTHWPGQIQPPGTSVDTSTEMAFAHLDAPVAHEPAEVVTNNHFDQDGAAGLFALLDPEAALQHRELLVDLADAGDFGRYHHRNAARVSMILNAFSDPGRSPAADQLVGDMTTDTARLYEIVLPQLLDLLHDPSPHRDLWAEEDEALSASEAAIESGRVTITEDRGLDLAVVAIDDTEPVRSGHRFGHLQLGPIHPMAVHNATDRTRLLMAHRGRFLYVDRYETWVQVHTLEPPLRVDLRPLAEALGRAEPGDAAWRATAPSVLTPHLDHDGESGLDGDHLRASPPAWDPYDQG